MVIMSMFLCVANIGVYIKFYGFITPNLQLTKPSHRTQLFALH